MSILCDYHADSKTWLDSIGLEILISCLKHFVWHLRLPTTGLRKEPCRPLWMMRGMMKRLTRFDEDFSGSEGNPLR